MLKGRASSLLCVEGACSKCNGTLVSLSLRGVREDRDAKSGLRQDGVPTLGYWTEPVRYAAAGSCQVSERGALK